MKIVVVVLGAKLNFPFVRRCLDSVERQTLKPHLVTILDSALKPTDISNFGYSFSIQLAQNINEIKDLVVDVVSFFHSHDEMHPQRLEYIVKTFRETQCDYVTHDYLKVQSQKQSRCFPRSNYQSVKQTGESKFEHLSIARSKIQNIDPIGSETKVILGMLSGVHITMKLSINHDYNESVSDLLIQSRLYQQMNYMTEVQMLTQLALTQCTGDEEMLQCYEILAQVDILGGFYCDKIILSETSSLIAKEQALNKLKAYTTQISSKTTNHKYAWYDRQNHLFHNLDARSCPDVNSITHYISHLGDNYYISNSLLFKNDQVLSSIWFPIQYLFPSTSQSDIKRRPQNGEASGKDDNKSLYIISSWCPLIIYYLDQERWKQIYHITNAGLSKFVNLAAPFWMDESLTFLVRYKDVPTSINLKLIQLRGKEVIIGREFQLARASPAHVIGGSASAKVFLPVLDAIYYGHNELYFGDQSINGDDLKNTLVNHIEIKDVISDCDQARRITFVSAVLEADVFEPLEQLIGTGILLGVYVYPQYEGVITTLAQKYTNVKVLGVITLTDLVTYQIYVGTTPILPSHRNSQYDTDEFMLKNNEKPFFVQRAIEKNWYGTDYFAWVNPDIVSLV